MRKNSWIVRKKDKAYRRHFVEYRYDTVSSQNITCSKETYGIPSNSKIYKFWHKHTLLNKQLSYVYYNLQDNVNFLLYYTPTVILMLFLSLLINLINNTIIVDALSLAFTVTLLLLPISLYIYFFIRFSKSFYYNKSKNGFIYKVLFGMIFILLFYKLISVSKAGNYAEMMYYSLVNSLYVAWYLNKLLYFINNESTRARSENFSGFYIAIMTSITSIIVSLIALLK